VYFDISKFYKEPSNQSVELTEWADAHSVAHL
jgi:hypothetical protein